MHSVLVLFLEEARSLKRRRAILAVDDPAGADIKTSNRYCSRQAGAGKSGDAQRDYLSGRTRRDRFGGVEPLGPKAHGISQIGASDADRFHPAMSTEFLSRIGELVTYALIR